MLPYLDECEVSITSNDPTVVTRSRSGRKFVRNLEQQRWELDVTWPSLLDDRARAVEMALDTMRGQSEAAQIIHPVRSNHTGATGSWFVSASASAGSKQVSMSGAGSLTLGHCVRFSGHSKTYRLIDDNAGSYSLYPALRKPVFASEQVFVSDVPITCTRTDDAISYKRSGPLTKISASFEEQL